MNKTRRCCECSNKATWVDSYAQVGEPMFYCSDCLPKTYEEGRFIYYKDGIEIPSGDKNYLIDSDDAFICLYGALSYSSLTKRDKEKIYDMVNDIFSIYTVNDDETAKYNPFMSDIGSIFDYMASLSTYKDKAEELLKVYNRFKINLKKKRFLDENLVLSEKDSIFAPKIEN